LTISPRNDANRTSAVGGAFAALPAGPFFAAAAGLVVAACVTAGASPPRADNATNFASAASIAKTPGIIPNISNARRRPPSFTVVVVVVVVVVTSSSSSSSFARAAAAQHFMPRRTDDDDDDDDDDDRTTGGPVLAGVPHRTRPVVGVLVGVLVGVRVLVSMLGVLCARASYDAVRPMRSINRN
jgi:hypothetical protein